MCMWWAAEGEGASPEEHSVLYKYDPATDKVVFKKSMFHGAKKEEELELEDIDGVAVDASGTLWVYWGGEGRSVDSADEESNRWQPSVDKDLEVEARFTCRATAGVRGRSER